MRKNDYTLKHVVPELDAAYLYSMLKEREIETTSISHEELPTWEDHLSFVERNTAYSYRSDYKAWYIIWNRPANCRCGSIYLTHRNEIGLQIERSWQYIGIGKWSIQEVMTRHRDVKRFFANINPYNGRSIHLFRSLGFFDCAIQLQWRREEHVDGPVIQSAGAGIREASSGHESEAGSRTSEPDDGRKEAS